MNKYLIASISSILILLFLYGTVTSNSTDKFYMVFDEHLSDSKILVHENNENKELSKTYEDYDLEGLTCLNNVLYLTSGKDGKENSSLYKFENNELYHLFTTDYKELSSLVSMNNKLYSFADEGEVQGIIEIDPYTFEQKLIFKDNKTTISALQYDERNNVFYAAGNNIIYYYNFSFNRFIPFLKLGNNIEIEGLLLDYPLLYIVGDNITNAIQLDLDTNVLSKSNIMIPNDVEDLTYCKDSYVPTATPTDIATVTPVPTVTNQAFITVTPTVVQTLVTPVPTATPISSVINRPTPFPTKVMIPTNIVGSNKLIITTIYTNGIFITGVENICGSLLGRNSRDLEEMQSAILICTDNYGHIDYELNPAHYYTLTFNSEVNTFLTPEENALYEFHYNMTELYIPAIQK